MYEKNQPTETEAKETALEVPTEKAFPRSPLSPVFVEAEKLFAKLADITSETASKAYEFFRQRGGDFGRELDDWFRAEREVLLPVPIEIKESDKEVTVSAAVPGFKPEQIEVSLKDNILILSGEKEDRSEREDENTIVKEWKSNRFFRQISLPAAVEAAQADATLRDGILNMTIPKAEKREATRINVAAG